MKAVWLDGSDLCLRLYIQPKASRDALVGLHGDELKVAITAPPVDGKANAHLTKYLAKQCKVAKGAIEIEKGELGRHKQVRIHSPSIIPAEIQTLL
ncbi:DUF167 family protein YggU [Vibrio cincinnatiensis]|jgi:hypothetical protein|uniref:DUF167 family protein YggU n=1 Tax=Vibrio cincinnatiensis TaxID=675 RepID=UPI0013022070|nr:DUF167 family protein YggU [Vibrio cincinnatiensis]MCG3721843.1 YggU family protein [Vibrio cincinnatiensis]MCG3737263.1 YggU family protein [Vibrio cincinnatiensis]